MREANQSASSTGPHGNETAEHFLFPQYLLELTDDVLNDLHGILSASFHYS